MNYTTIDKFEQGRLPLALDGLLILVGELKSRYRKYMKYRQDNANAALEAHFKNHADFEKFQRELTYQRNLPLFYPRA